MPEFAVPGIADDAVITLASPRFSAEGGKRVVIKLPDRVSEHPAKLLPKAVTSPLSPASNATATIDFGIYPQPAAGERVTVITLPKQTSERLMAVEVMPGRTIERDCSLVRFLATLQPCTVEGWGYEYYRVSNFRRSPITTRNKYSPDKRCIEWVGAAEANITLPYSSKRPIVVYAPADVEVKHRVSSSEGSWGNWESA